MSHVARICQCEILTALLGGTWTEEQRQFPLTLLTDGTAILVTCCEYLDHRQRLQGIQQRLQFCLRRVL